MIHAGDTLYNPVTGESMTFVTSSRQTDGEYVLIELSADPDASVAAAVWMQKLGPAVGDPAGKLLGYDPTDVAVPAPLNPAPSAV